MTFSFSSIPFRYDDAKVLLEKMGGDEVPPEWRGNITGITYRLGGIMEPAAYKVRLSTHNYFGKLLSFPAYTGGDKMIHQRPNFYINLRSTYILFGSK